MACAAFRVALVSQGTRGDTQPFLALAKELERRGHEVAMCCSACCVPLARDYGIRATGMTFDPRKAIESPEMQEAIDQGGGSACVRAFMLAQEEQIRSSGVDPADEVYDFLKGFGADVLVCHPSFLPLHVVAEAFSLPVVNAVTQPFLPSAVEPPVFFSQEQLAKEGLVGRPVEAHKLIWDSYIHAQEFERLNRLRVKWGLRPYEHVTEAQAIFQSAPHADCWSSALLPEPLGFQEQFPYAQQTGYLADASLSYDAPPELVAFLSACGEEKPVYVGFGSLCVGHPGQATEKLLRAVKKAGVRCVMAGGWAGIGPHCLDSQAEDFEELKAFADAHVYHLEEAPHAWLLPRCCGALYHGGANTVGAVALAGIPGAIAPVAWDQPWWAEYMEKLEVGINLQQIISKVDEDMLVSAFLRLSNDRFLAQRAAGLAEKLKS